MFKYLLLTSILVATSSISVFAEPIRDPSLWDGLFSNYLKDGKISETLYDTFRHLTAELKDDRIPPLEGATQKGYDKFEEDLEQMSEIIFNPNPNGPRLGAPGAQVGSNGYSFTYADDHSQIRIEKGEFFLELRIVLGGNWLHADPSRIGSLRYQNANGSVSEMIQAIESTRSFFPKVERRTVDMEEGVRSAF